MADDTADRRPVIGEPVSSERRLTDGAGPELDRLPPPAFPRGASRSRRHEVPRPQAPVGRDEGEEESDGVPFDAFISPDDPIRKEARGVPDDAFISPDDPVIPVDRDASGRVSHPPEEPSGSVVQPSGGRNRPTIHELAYLLDQLAERLHESGERALEVHPDTGHFQAALRSFLKGYLEGGRSGGGAD